MEVIELDNIVLDRFYCTNAPTQNQNPKISQQSQIEFRHLNIKFPCWLWNHLSHKKKQKTKKLRTVITFAYEMQIRLPLVHRNPLSKDAIANHLFSLEHDFFLF